MVSRFGDSVQPLKNYAGDYKAIRLGGESPRTTPRSNRDLSAPPQLKVKRPQHPVDQAAKEMVASHSAHESHSSAVPATSNSQILKGLLMEPINLLLAAAPIGVLAAHCGWDKGTVFCTCFVGLVPLAKLLGDATEHLAENLNQTVGGLLNATFGNAVEMIITLNAIRGGYLEIVKQSLIGSILSNLLLVLGMSFFVGGLTRSEQRFPGAAALINVTMLLVGIMSFALPTIFSLGSHPQKTLAISRISAVFVAVGYLAYLVFQLCTHVELFEDEKDEEVKDAGESGTDEEPGAVKLEFLEDDGSFVTFTRNEAGEVKYALDGEVKLVNLSSLRTDGCAIHMVGTSMGAWGDSLSLTVPLGQEALVDRVLLLWERRPQAEEKEEPFLDIPWAIVLLLTITVAVASLSEYLVASIEGLVDNWGVPPAFVGIILLPIVGNACEHASAVSMAHKDKMAAAIAVAVGSSTQIAILVMPFAVIAAWCVGQPLDLDLHLIGLAVIFLSVLVVFSIVVDGKSNWLEGFMLMLAYCLTAVLFWLTPSEGASL